jgi:uncharacterized protein (DUF362 family)/ferredoxin
MSILKTASFSDSPVFYSNARSASEIQSTVNAVFDAYGALLPEAKNSRILIKPNLHKDLNALMSNTTDLRLVVSVIRALQSRGYSDITIGEGPNCGTYRLGIDVFKRLRVDRLAEYLGVHYLDLNRAEQREVDLHDGRRARIARIVLENDFFINMPKIKTHLIVRLSVCVKSLVGVLSGMQKRQMHYDLMENLLKINDIVKPDLYIVDGLIAGEGQGPGICTPRRLDLIVSGTNPYLTDLACSKFAGFDYDELDYLRLAYNRGLLSEKDLDVCKGLRTHASIKRAKKPLMVKVVDLKSLIWLRNLTRPFFDIGLISKLLYRLQIREDDLIQDDDKILELRVSRDVCDRCERCHDFCPVGIVPYQDGINADCIECFYCYMVCPKEAISIEGELGFMDPLMRNYVGYTREI